MTFGSDLDVGIYRPAANQLGFTTAGVLAGFFDSGGKLWLEDALDIAGAIDVAGTSILTGAVTASASLSVGTTLSVTGVGTFSSTVELGHASDTTLSRSAAGRLAVEGRNAILNGQSDTLTAGYNVTEFNAGTQSSGTYTPAPLSGNFQRAVNGGAHTLAPPATSCSMVIQYTNNASAGAITTSGFTKVQGAFTTTNGDDFMCYITRNNSFSHLNIVALQ
jgi:hypothetical protein